MSFTYKEKHSINFIIYESNDDHRDHLRLFTAALTVKKSHSICLGQDISIILLLKLNRIERQQIGKNPQILAELSSEIGTTPLV